MFLKQKNIIVFLTCCALFVFSCLYLHSKYSKTDTIDFVGQDEQGDPNEIDELDYHFVATNFALAGRFPVTGFLMDTSIYEIKREWWLDYVYSFSEWA